MPILLEVCIDSIESARAAKQGGADRLEVCSSLAAGGTTPSFGLVEQCLAEVELPVMMMIRPHDGGFVYSADDLRIMLADIRTAQSLGVQGVVFGALTEELRIHKQQCAQLVDAAGPLETTFHRAFDVAADPLATFDDIVGLGFDRLLSSGQAATAEQGVPLLRQLRQRADASFAVLPGAGVNESNAPRIVAETGVGEVHASASVAGAGQSTRSVAFGNDRRITSAEVVQAIKLSLRSVRA